MPTQLKIKWEGTAPGLANQRLSLSAFGRPLNTLLSALRRIATNIVGQALDETKASAGRFTNEARQLDIEIVDLVRESSGIDSVVSLNAPVGESFPLFGDLAEDAVRNLLEAIDLERRGTARNARVRAYLQALPPGITRQTYQLHQNGTLLKQVSFSSVDLPLLPADLPYLCEYIGRIVGVGFEPGRTEVRVRTEEEAHETGPAKPPRVATLAATSKQVDTALELRHSQVRAIAVCHGDERRLLILQDVSLPLRCSSRETIVFERWRGLLERLAK